MDCRDEAIAYHSPPSSLTGIVGGRCRPPPESGTQVVRVCRNVHGPVEARAGGVAYARRYAIWGRELETLVGSGRASTVRRNIREVDARAAQVTWNENVIAADSSGNIGYWHPGLLPLRPKGWDERLPYPGTGEAEWRGPAAARADPARDQPHARAGWRTGTTCRRPDWTSGDGTARKRIDGAFFRAGLLFPLVERLRAGRRSRGCRTSIHRSGTTAQQFPVARGRLAAAARGLRSGKGGDGAGHAAPRGTATTRGRRPTARSTRAWRRGRRSANSSSA